MNIFFNLLSQKCLAQELKANDKYSFGASTNKDLPELWSLTRLPNTIPITSSYHKEEVTVLSLNEIDMYSDCKAGYKLWVTINNWIYYTNL